jgi:tetratricopeptide (TPR) repeat protein
VATSLNNLGNLHRDENRNTEARAAYEESLKIRRALALKNPDVYLPYVATSLNNLGILHRQENRKIEARAALSEALEIYKQFLQRSEGYRANLNTVLGNLIDLD